MLIHTKGNLLAMAEAGKFNVIVHGCNCFCDMGGGIAKQLATKYPEVAAADDRYQAINPIDKLGNFSSIRIGNEISHNFIVINAYTQVPGGGGENVFEYESFGLILRKLVIRYPGANFGLPYIGCGIAGGDPERIVPMIERFAESATWAGGSATLVEYANV